MFLEEAQKNKLRRGPLFGKFVNGRKIERPIIHTRARATCKISPPTASKPTRMVKNDGHHKNSCKKVADNLGAAGTTVTKDTIIKMLDAVID